jgi:hypothetical protein
VEILVIFATEGCGNSSVGRASAFQAEGREFESRFPLSATHWVAFFLSLKFEKIKKAVTDSLSFFVFGVEDRVRTDDPQNHNLML